jgi:thiosulfate reductase cytochrome b subunit
VVFVLAPLAILTGLSMSPQLDSLLGWWLALVGGRQSARSIHFAVMALFVLFAAVHVLMVVYAGPVNEMRSMLSGRFRVRWPRGGEGGDGE